MAVKVLQSEDPAEAQAIARETAILEGLHHLHVVAYYDHIVAEDGTVSLLSSHALPLSTCTWLPACDSSCAWQSASSG